MQTKKLAISLRGGGANAAAYIGVLKALEEDQIKVDMIIGSSGGAIVGGLYSIGLGIDEIEGIFKETSIRNYVNFDSVRDLALVSSERALDFLHNVTEGKNIEETETKLFIQATNVVTKNCDILEQGDLATAIIASSAIPLIVKPVEFNGNLFIDGDVTAGYGVEILRLKGSDIILGANSYGNKYIEDKEDHMKFINRILDPFIISQIKIRELDQRIWPVDILVDDLADPALNVIDFQSATSLINKGYEETKKALPKLKELLN